ncbi:phosphate ABC transporter ATP-binding protein [Salidesulfovibrio brasiliensis]|uniref:phosphate ABC transporter ATP-binding protein n=1 Tax=Salidesulfovibrio brasiliensis TaxID=221711 RepID=UPI0006D0AF07|nr:phosphate ABC transporter ATP-binding protein [Salidesulfovibrio brasiliensis]
MELSKQGKEAVRVEGLSVSFGGRAVIRDQSMHFLRDELSVLVGRSGSGKTTLLRSLNRLNECFDDCRTKGNVSVRFDGQWREVHDRALPVEELRRRVGMVFQTPNVLPASIRRNLTLPLKLTMNIRGDEAEGRMERALREAGLWEEVRDRLSRPAGTLSGGQQQRLCLARALALEPDVLLLDEPSASLDYRATKRIEELLLELRERYALIVVSHSLGQARRLADRLFVFREGELAETLSGDILVDEPAFYEMIEKSF